ncbi:MAG: GNAT family N-acetyltransferase [Gammaproteobacteria bacterium]|nr:GNAT family N-acetyltransferase [Gammaproteobacteria bacterium]MBU2056424.1 GNAT family N-acetyltransferase [Gammaproteobacteria bacterium]MBU2175504.1 GNAT family N-acetyltransferase [Gammaproteobacteria bacterium]MBU2246659.1 GNAT family N-acetyltransferase [Gammaproteobacteria bacterium]MBU2345877.1 GNAT family N-acetyltransferase [Gammaproteobacteria bacterium]
MRFEWLSSLAEVAAADWNGLFPADYPFCRYEFLLALEQGGSVGSSAGKNTGWLVRHFVVWQNDQLIAAVPAYIKLHSYGEYLFDWSFAEAYQNYGLDYYPKLLLAIPFTPAEGPRLGVAAGIDKAELLQWLAQGVSELQQVLPLSHLQCLYASPQDQQAFRDAGFIERFDVQFLWSNKNYSCFDDFLAVLTARKRKQIRKERAAVTEQGVVIKTLTGAELDFVFWQQFYAFYCDTYQKRSRHQGYLTADTFWRWGQTLAKQMVVFAAFKEDEMLAASLCFQSEKTLFGRYWGCKQDFNFLHFECCYYSGIDYCIRQGLQFFDAGAQGEHKLQRGFAPVLRHGFYRFTEKAEHKAMNEAIARYCVQEQRALVLYQQEAQDSLPFANRAD